MIGADSVPTPTVVQQVGLVVGVQHVICFIVNASEGQHVWIIVSACKQRLSMCRNSCDTIVSTANNTAASIRPGRLATAVRVDMYHFSCIAPKGSMAQKRMSNKADVVSRYEAGCELKANELC